MVEPVCIIFISLSAFNFLYCCQRAIRDLYEAQAVVQPTQDEENATQSIEMNELGKKTTDDWEEISKMEKSD